MRRYNGGTVLKATSFIFTKAVLDKVELEEGKQISRFFDTHKRSNGLMLSIRQSGRKSFVVRYKLAGKDVSVTLGKYPQMTIEQARKKAQEVSRMLVDGVNPHQKKKADVSANTTLLECFNDYIRVNHQLAKSTIDSYTVSLSQYLKDWQNKPLLSISRDMVERRHLKIGETSPTRANYTMRLLRALFNFAHGEYENEKGEPLFVHNPVARISHKKLWFKETRRSSFISGKDMPKWYDGVVTLPEWLEHKQANTESIRDYLLFLWITGLRRTECAMIQKSWIDLDNKSVTIPGEVTKNGMEHQLPLTDYLMDIVNPRMKEEGLFLFNGKTPEDYIKEPKRIIKQIRERTEVHFTIHDLRRTFITNAEYLGYSGYTLKRLLNHRNKADVTDEYIVSDVENLRPVMQAITNRLVSVALPGGGDNVVQLRR